MNPIGQALDILNRAYDFWQPNWIFFLYSGGDDSVCATDIGVAWARDKMHPHAKVISIDTHVSADGWRDYVTRVARRWYYLHEIWDNSNPDFYTENCRAYGFPYTKEMHWTIMYRNLKERAIDAVRAAHKADRRDRCMLVSGIRRDESDQRKNEPEWKEDGAGLWVSPLVDWTEQDTYEYRLIRGFEPNPFYETIGGSGDCECNWGQFTDIETLERYSPNLAARIRPVHEECLVKFGYGYGERGSEALRAEMAGQLVLPGVEPIMNLCAGCARHYDPIEAEVQRKIRGGNDGEV